MMGGVAGAVFGTVNGAGTKADGITGIMKSLGLENVPLYAVLIAAMAVLVLIVVLVVWRIKKGKASSGTLSSEDDSFAGSSGDEEAGAAASPGDDKIISKVVMICDAGEVHAPCEGKVRNYTEIPDETFASGVLGEGVGIEPAEENIYAPFDGIISSVADAKHAISLTGPGNMELLIHVGVDTVSLKGDGFTPYVKKGDEVRMGQKLMHFDRKKIAAAGFPDMVVTLLTNSADMRNFKVKL